MQPQICEVANFITSLYKSKLSYRAINCARSALSSFILFDNLPVGKHPLIKRLLKGIFERRPALIRNYTWDVNIVLDYWAQIGPAKLLNMKQLTIKLVIILALACAARQQTLQAISVDNIIIKNNTMKIIFTKKLKTSGPNKHLSEINLKAYPNKKLCPIWYTNAYIKATKNKRKSKQLLLITQKPHTPASKDTIANWIRNALSQAGINTKIYTPHSTRAAATSAMKKANTPIGTILKTAGWHNAETFAKHYNKTVDQHGSGSGLHLLQPPTQ
jgi:integrase